MFITFVVHSLCTSTYIARFYSSSFPTLALMRPSHFHSICIYRQSTGSKRTITGLPRLSSLGQTNIPITWPSALPMEKKKVVSEKVYSGSPNAKRYEVTRPWTTIKTSQFLRLAVYRWFMIVGTRHFLIHRRIHRRNFSPFSQFAASASCGFLSTSLGRRPSKGRYDQRVKS